jgi:hypothetical protein
MEGPSLFLKFAQMDKKGKKSSVQKDWIAWCRDLSAQELARLPFQKIPFPEIQLSEVLIQAQSYALARKKLPGIWNEAKWIFPDKTSIEQCSSEWTAWLKPQLLPRRFRNWMDATAGLGIDSWFARPHFEAIFLFETEPRRRNHLQKNFNVGGQNGNLYFFEKPFFQAWKDGELAGLQEDSLIYVDPDRRPDPEKARAFSWKDSSPNLIEIYEYLSKTQSALLVKFSPMDSQEEIIKSFPGAQRLWVISVHNEVKELLVYWDFSEPAKSFQKFAIDIRHDFSWRSVSLPYPDQEELPFPEMETPASGFILDPWASIRKGNIDFQWARQQGFICLSKRAHLFYEEDLPIEFPGRVFQIQLKGNDLKALIGKSGKRDFQFLARGFSIETEVFQKKFGGKGSDFDFIFCLDRPGGKREFVWAIKR